MTSKIYIATAGDDVRFWQENDQTAFGRLSPVRGPLACMDWSENGFQMLACGQESQPLSVVTVSEDLKNGPSINTTALSALPGTASVASYGHEQGNSSLAVGYDAGKVAIVNGRTLEVNKKLPNPDGKRTIMSLCFDTSDTRLAVSDDSGNIVVHNVIQAVHGKPLPEVDGAIVRQVKFSLWKKSVLASGSDNGAVTLWDVYRSAKIHHFSGTHSMPITGLVFSALNDMLLLSAGLDKQFCCLDVRGHKVVKTVHTDSALCSLDFHHEGWAVGVGTTRGRVLIYDLRQTSKPVREIVAHQTSVQTVKFASKNSLLTSEHLQQNRGESPVPTKTRKGSASSAISPLCANENTITRAVPVSSSPDRLASFYTRPTVDTAVKVGDSEYNQKMRLLQAQRMLSQTPSVSVTSYFEQSAVDTENIFRSQSVDLAVRARMDDTFRIGTVESRLPSPIAANTRERSVICVRSELNIPNAVDRPFPAAASTPFQCGVSKLAAFSTISSLPSRIPVAESSRPESTASFISAGSHPATTLTATTEDSWSPSPPPFLSDTLRENAQTSEMHTQTLVVGEFPPAVDQKEVSTQTEIDFVDSSVSLRDFSNLLDERLDPLDEKIRRLNSRFIAQLCDQTAELRKMMIEELSPNIKLNEEIERLKRENEQLRETVSAYDAKLFNTTLRL